MYCVRTTADFIWLCVCVCLRGEVTQHSYFREHLWKNPGVGHRPTSKPRCKMWCTIITHPSLSQYYNPILLCFHLSPPTPIPPSDGPFLLPALTPPNVGSWASFFNLPLGLCCQRAALRKSLFLPGRASCVPPPSSLRSHGCPPHLLRA